jgi:arylsulfatase A-like enzyme
VVATTLAVTGCSDDRPVEWPVRPPGPFVDLVSEFRYAHRFHQVSTVNFGTLEARPHLAAGWSYDEDLGNGIPVTWGLAPYSEIEHFVATPRVRRLEAVCLGHGTKGSPPTPVEVLVNGKRAGRILVEAGLFRTYTVELASHMLERGVNTIRFEYGGGTGRSAGRVGPIDGRPLAVLFDRVRLVGAADAQPPAVEHTGTHDRILLPTGSSLRMYLELQRSSTLWLAGLDGITPTSTAKGLRVTIRDDTGTTLTADTVRVGDRGVALPVALTHDAIVELELTPVGRNVRDVDGVALVDPVILSDATQTEVEVITSDPDYLQVPRPNILVYVVDCLRADRVGSHRGDMPVTPRMDGFAESAVVFTRAMSHSSWTRSAVASLLSGLLPTVHGVHGDDQRLPDEITLISEILQPVGYLTASVVTNGMVSEQFGFDQGYDSFERLPEQHASNPEIHELSDRLNDAFLAWIDGVDATRPFFAYLHATDPHSPYQPRSPYREKFAPDAPFRWGRHDRVEALTQGRVRAGASRRQALSSLYDAEVAYNDDQFGRLMDALRDRRLHRTTIVVVTADHGEEFHDHGRWQHGFTLYDEQLHVPLMIGVPWLGGDGPHLRTEPVMHVDLVPTLLHMAGLDVPSDLPGAMLLNRNGSDRLAPADRQSVAVLERHPRFRDVDSITKGRYKLIRNRVYDLARPRIELYDVSRDPQEQQNLVRDRPVISGWLESLLDRARDVEGYASREADIDPETEEALRALGYLE